MDDFDQDGWDDVAVSRSDDTFQILWNTGGVTVNPSAFTLAENRSANTLVGTVIASGDTPLHFAMTAGNRDTDSDSDPAFTINPVSGAVTVNDSGDLDHETTPRFILQVTTTVPTAQQSEPSQLPKLTHETRSANFFMRVIGTPMATTIQLLS